MVRELTSFLAIWFKSLKEHTFKVKVVGEKKDYSPALTASLKLLEDLKNKKSIDYSKLILSLKDSLDELNKKEISLVIPEPKEVDFSDVIKAIKAIQIETKDVDVKGVEKLLSELKTELRKVEVINPTKFPKSMEVFGKVSVENFPKEEKEEVNFSPVIAVLEKVVDEIRDMKLEMNQSLKNVSTVTSSFAGMTGSYKEKTKGTILYDPSDAAPVYIGTHAWADAPTSDENWEIIKQTYSGDNVTKMVTRKGTWDGRSSLF